MKRKETYRHLKPGAYCPFTQELNNDCTRRRAKLRGRCRRGRSAKEGDGGGPNKPDVKRPDTNDLLKRMKRVDPDAARRYRQRSGQ